MMANPHLVAIMRILAHDCPDAPLIQAAQAGADIAAYLDQLLAGVDAGLRAIPRTPSGLIPIDVAVRAVANAEPTLTVPRPRTEHTPGLITRASNGSWAVGREEKDRG